MDNVKAALDRLDRAAISGMDAEFVDDYNTIRAHIEGLEAEKAAQFIRAREWAERCGQQEARAEAAEARVRELEGLLIRARNPHAAKCPAAYRDSDTCTYGLDAALSTTPEAAQK